MYSPTSVHLNDRASSHFFPLICPSSKILHIRQCTTDVHKIVNGVGVAARFIVFIHERIAQPEVFQVGLGMFEALGQGIHVVILVIGNRPLIFGHDRADSTCKCNTLKVE